MDAYESIIQSRTAVEMADVAPTTQQVNQLFGQMSESFKKVDAEVAAKLAPSKQQQALMESQKLLKEFNNAQLIDHIIDHYNMLDHLKPALTEMVYNREDPILIKNLVRKIAQHPDKDKIFSQMFNYLDHYIVDNENIRKSIGTDHFEIALRSKLDFEYVNNREILEKFLYRGHATMEPLVYTHAVLDMADIYFNPHGPQTNIAPALIVKSLTYKDDPRFIALMKKISSIQLTKNHLFDEELFREYVRAMNTHKHRMQPWMLESLQQLLENNKIFSKTQSYSIAKQILPNTSTLSKLCSLIYKVRR